MKHNLLIGIIFTLILSSCAEHEAPQAKIAFLGEVDDIYGRLCIMNEDGTEFKVITEFAGVRYPKFSPDGSKIAFGRRGDIYVIDIDGNNLINLTNDEYDFYDYLSSFYCEGNEIIYTRYDPELKMDQIYIIGIDGSNNRLLINSQTGNRLIALSPDCNHLVYESKRNDDWIQYINTIHNNSEKQLFDYGSFIVSFFPDGQKILYVRNDSGANIYTMNIDGSNKQNIYNEEAGIRRLRLSSDGQKLAYLTSKDGHKQIYVLNADGSNPRNITNDLMYKSFLSFSPDGSKLIYDVYSSDFSASYIYRINIDGTHKKDITPGSIKSWSPFYQPIIR